MKPYKIIKSTSVVPAKKILVGPLKPPKVPLWFVKDVFTPPKASLEFTAPEAGLLPNSSDDDQDL